MLFPWALLYSGDSLIQKGGDKNMNKQKIVPLAALALVALGGATLGFNQMSPTVVHAQAQTAQVQQKEVPGSQEKAETTEPVSEAGEKNLPGGGHQDTGETADHQFEGVE